jgi:hypothetical protein
VTLQAPLLLEPVFSEQRERRIVLGKDLYREFVNIMRLCPRHSFLDEGTGNTSPPPVWTNTEAERSRSRVTEGEGNFADNFTAPLGYELNVLPRLDERPDSFRAVLHVNLRDEGVRLGRVDEPRNCVRVVGAGEADAEVRIGSRP